MFDQEASIKTVNIIKENFLSINEWKTVIVNERRINGM